MKSRKYIGLWVLVALLSFLGLTVGFCIYSGFLTLVCAPIAFVSFCVVAYRLEESWKRDIINGSQQIQP